MGATVCGSGNRDARILLGRPARRSSRRLPQAGPVGAASVFQPEAPAGGTRWLQRRRFDETPTPHSRQCRPIPLSKSQLPTPPQKRSDGEGPGERPQKRRQAATNNPSAAKPQTPLLRRPKQSPQKQITVGATQPRASARGPDSRELHLRREQQCIQPTMTQSLDQRS